MTNDRDDLILEARNLVKEVRSPAGILRILDGVSLSVYATESLAVVGVSGSGKSTLLGLLAGLDTPTQGEVVFDGQMMSALDEDGRARLRAYNIGFVFQSFHLLPNLSAMENVLLPLELNPDPDISALPAAREVLHRVGLADRAEHYPSQLSGGEQQRVAIARAFVSQPTLLFADEPTGNLDRKTGSQISDLLFQLNRDSGTTLVVVTHDTQLAQCCERQLELADGRLLNNTDA